MAEQLILKGTLEGHVSSPLPSTVLLVMVHLDLWQNTIPIS
jgi:hypothetical protein